MSTFEDLKCYVCDVNKFKIWKSKQEKKKENQKRRENEIDEQFNFTDDRRGFHQKHYHNQAIIYQSKHSEI